MLDQNKNKQLANMQNNTTKKIVHYPCTMLPCFLLCCLFYLFLCMSSLYKTLQTHTTFFHIILSLFDYSVHTKKKLKTKLYSYLINLNQLYYAIHRTECENFCIVWKVVFLSFKFIIDYYNWCIESKPALNLNWYINYLIWILIFGYYDIYTILHWLKLIVSFDWTREIL